MHRFASQGKGSERATMVESADGCGGEERTDGCTGGKSLEGANGTTSRITALAARSRKVTIVVGRIIEEQVWPCIG